MDTYTESTPARPRKWWEVRYPALYYAVGATFIAVAIGWLMAPGGNAPPLLIAVEFAIGLLNFLLATLTIITRVRVGERAIEQPPLAQESDPTRR